MRSAILEHIPLRGAAITAHPIGSLSVLEGNLLVVPLGVTLLCAAPWLMRAVVALDRRPITRLIGSVSLTDRVRDLEHARAHAVDDSAARRRRHRAEPARWRAGPDGRRGHEAWTWPGRISSARLARRPRRKPGCTVPWSWSAPRTASPRRPSSTFATWHAASTRRSLTTAWTPRWRPSPRAVPPTELIADLPERPSAAIEAIAYFCAAELLTNVAKHSGASHATMEAVHVPGLLRLRVSDDGGGGARLGGAGSGIGGCWLRPVQRLRPGQRSAGPAASAGPANSAGPAASPGSPSGSGPWTAGCGSAARLGAPRRLPSSFRPMHDETGNARRTIQSGTACQCGS